MKPHGLLLTGLLVLSIFALSNSVQGQYFTPVNGLIEKDTIWSKMDSPYQLTGPVGVKEGATLTIQSGVTVNLSNHYIQVNGTLIAKGTSSQMITLNLGYITFTTKSNSWNEQTGSGSIMEYCSMTASNGVSIEGGSPKVSFSEIPQITITQGSPIITNNSLVNIIGENMVEGSPQIIGNKMGVVKIAGSGYPTIASNIIESYVICNSAVICNNRISYSPHGGDDQAIPIVSMRGNGVIANNSITGLVTPAGPDPATYGARTIGPFYTFYGITVSGNVLVSNNVVSGCTKASITVSGGNPNIQQNSLGNTSIKVNAGAPKINYNNIGSKLVLSNMASSDIDATNNWWGTIDNATIDQLIYDNKDDFNLGKVNYTPFLTAPNPQAQADLNAPIPTTQPTNIPTGTPDQQNGSLFGQETTAIAVIAVSIIVLLIVAGMVLRKRAK